MLAMDNAFFLKQPSSHTAPSLPTHHMHHTSTHSNTANHIYIYHYWPSVLPPHRCRCTHSDSTICLHITLTAPSLPEVGHSVFYAYFYHHLSSHHCTSSLRGRTMSLFTYTYLSKNLRTNGQLRWFWLSAFDISLYFPPSVHLLHVSCIHLQLFALFFFCCLLPICPLPV
jgi:hypothetical protein